MSRRAAMPLAAVALAVVLVSGCGGPGHSPAAIMTFANGPSLK